MNRLVIVGAGGHGKVIADSALKSGYTDINFVDDNITGECMGVPIVGKTYNLENLNDGNTDFIIGIGDNNTRKRIAEKYNVNWVSIYHPSAQIAVSVFVGKGTIVMAGAVINACASIGEHCIINTCAVVEHDDIIEDYVHISPNATLGGTVYIGEKTHIGIGSVISSNTNVCSDCVVGAGAVVVKDIASKGTYVGIPAKMKK